MKTSKVENDGKTVKKVPQIKKYEFQRDCKVPKLRVMFVGLGGNNGTITTAGIYVNKKKLVWNQKEEKSKLLVV